MFKLLKTLMLVFRRLTVTGGTELGTEPSVEKMSPTMAAKESRSAPQLPQEKLPDAVAGEIGTSLPDTWVVSSRSTTGANRDESHKLNFMRPKKFAHSAREKAST